MNELVYYAYVFVAIILSISVHEASHALMAYRLGDPTAKYLGRLTLNPVAHLDPLGTLMIVITTISGFGIGWGKPVPVNPYNLRNGAKTGMAMVSVAGPLSNLVLASFLAIPMRLDLIPDPTVFFVFRMMVLLNIALAVFNMIPIPPLDGFKVLQGILPNRQAYALSSLETYGPAILMLVIFVGPYFRLNVLGMILGPLMRIGYWLIAGGAVYG
ncbi:MAG: site-2 protease family protein [Chloroflexi bacterium]|nr:site-2 protease family protein [Chloroflexota bacterium]